MLLSGYIITIANANLIFGQNVTKDYIIAFLENGYLIIVSV